jgi:hypothetical protein
MLAGVQPDSAFAAFCHNTGALSIVPFTGAVNVRLGGNMSDIVTFAPVFKVRSVSSRDAPAARFYLPLSRTGLHTWAAHPHVILTSCGGVLNDNRWARWNSQPWA